MTAVTGGAALTGQNSHLLSHQTFFFFFFFIFAPSWTEPLNVHITVVLVVVVVVGGVKDQSAIHKALYGVFVYMYAIFVFILCDNTLTGDILFLPLDRLECSQTNVWSPYFIS